MRNFRENCQRCAISREVVSSAPFPGKLSALRNNFPESCQQCPISRKAVSGAPFPGKLSAVSHFSESCQRCAIFQEVVIGALLGKCQWCAISREVVSGAPFSGWLSMMCLFRTWYASAFPGKGSVMSFVRMVARGEFFPIWFSAVSFSTLVVSTDLSKIVVSGELFQDSCQR